MKKLVKIRNKKAFHQPDPKTLYLKYDVKPYFNTEVFVLKQNRDVIKLHRKLNMVVLLVVEIFCSILVLQF